MSPAQLIVAKELEFIDTILETAYAEKKKQKDVAQDPQFKELPAKRKRELRKEIKDRLNPADMNAARRIEES